MGEGFSYHSVRIKVKRLKDELVDVGIEIKDPLPKTIASTVEKSFRSERAFTQEEILLMHNLDPSEFQIKTIKRNQWQMTTGEGDSHWNYQSTITAEPIRDDKLSPERLVEHFKDLKPRKFNIRDDIDLLNYLLIPIADPHFGFNTLEDYEGLLNDILDQIHEGYAEILITLHGDYFHVDNLLGTTEKGTKVDDINLYQAAQDGHDFIASIIETSLKNCPCVKLVYLPGNHAPSNDMIFTMGLKKLYPDLEVDDAPSDFKHSWLGPHSIFMHHGDKRSDPRKLLEVFISRYAKEWGESNSRYLITGHLHHEKSLSVAGMTHYQVMSPSKASSFEIKNGFNTSEDGMMLFEFDDVKRRKIYYL